MFGSYLPYVLGVVLVSLSCNPGNYDIASCDPNVPTLNADACNALNAHITDCSMVYQCDKATSLCKQGPRDYDRDGDPDKMCGGTDCNDYDPSISGLNKLCGCDQKTLGTSCSVGDGACVATATYSCKDGSLFCTVPNPMPVPDPDYMKAPYTNGSWDWDCDSKQSMKCPDRNGALADCPAMGNCAGTMFNVDSTSTQVASACTSYCNGLQLSACKSSPTFICAPGCGKPIFYCDCAPGGTFNLTCTGSIPAPASSVRCK